MKRYFVCGTRTTMMNYEEILNKFRRRNHNYCMWMLSQSLCVCLCVWMYECTCKFIDMVTFWIRYMQILMVNFVIVWKLDSLILRILLRTFTHTHANHATVFLETKTPTICMILCILLDEFLLLWILYRNW